MGKGDMKTKRGKIHRGTYGKNRTRKVAKSTVASVKNEEEKAVKVKKTTTKPEVKSEAKPEVKEVKAEAPVKETKAKKTEAKPKKEATEQTSLFDNE
ncbi:MAG: 30S ribosomal protein THX [Bacteroidales bacterium]|jgi:ribosomal small subunit protein bTHX|nr:30S ribosomal protein THX [Bacteroidales bacterium]